MFDNISSFYATATCSYTVYSWPSITIISSALKSETKRSWMILWNTLCFKKWHPFL